jgi:hypothetical protein
VCFRPRHGCHRDPPPQGEITSHPPAPIALGPAASRLDSHPLRKKTWLKIAKTAGKKAAAVAIARKILVLMWTLVRKDEPYKAREPVAA